MELKPDCFKCFAGLACRIRVEILSLLREKKMPVMEIAKHFKVTQPTITHHLKYLKKVGILASKREGRKIYYFINPKCGRKSCEIFR